MQELIGKQFSLEQDSFQIVDVRNFTGNYMIYASVVGRDHEQARDGKDAVRRAFRFEDIAHLLVPARSA